MLALVLPGCAGLDKQAPAPQPAPAIQPLEQTMQEAAQASAAGSKDRARELYRTAAKNYPTSKAPWLKLSEDYFEAGNYGQAILAAQEVLQRDSSDSAATSVLAVSGLRVSSSALTALRAQQRPLNGSTRSEAEELAHVLREQLGEAVLVPRPAAGTSTTVRKRPSSAQKQPAVTTPSGPAPAAASATAPAKPEASNPFNVLKN